MAYSWDKGSSGALTGATVGSSLGPWGAAGGGLLGLLLGFMGDDEGMKKIETLDPQQKETLKNILGSLSPEGALGKGYNQGIGLMSQLMDPSSSAVERFAQPYMQQFEQQTIPGLAEQFAGAGGGALSSSGFGQALSTAGSNLQSQLAALKAGLGQQAAQQLMGQYGNMANLGLGTAAFGYQKPQESMLMNLLGGFAGGAGKAFGQKGFDKLFS